MSLVAALSRISTHRDVVPLYYVRSANRWIVTGVNRTHGGAVVVDDAGEIEQVCGTKRDALAAVGVA